jgi:hypothetical protein
LLDIENPKMPENWLPLVMYSNTERKNEQMEKMGQSQEIAAKIVL